MSKRYSIDDPVLDDDLEEDIVLGSFHPTDRDRDLLRADEAVLNDIQSKSSSHGFKSSRFFSGKTLINKYKKLASESSSSKKKVGFAPVPPSYDEITSTGGSNSKGYSKLSNTPSSSLRHSDSPYSPDYRNLNDSDSDDYESDIEIDINEGLSRSELRKRTRRLHGILLVLILFIGVWFAYNNVFPFVARPDKSHLPPSVKVMSNGTHEFRPTTIVVSLDGFHPHYVNQELTPNLHILMTEGGGAPYMTPSFPSSTFPNHWTMVTGLYPSNHGIIGNTFWDTKLNKQFFNTKPGQSLDPVWWGGQPIWLTAANQGVHAAVHMWPGSEVQWDKGSLIETDKYNGSESLESKNDRVFSWIDRETEDRPELILAYVPTVDTVGHTVGISGTKLVDALKEVDSLVGNLMEGLDNRNLTNIVNLVVVSDHGMAPTSNDRLIYLDDLVEMSNIEHLDGWPLIGLRPISSLNIKALYHNLWDAHNQFGEGKWDVYLREELPEEWHFGGKNYNKYKERLAPIWLIPHVGWAITTKEQMEKLNGQYQPHGIHGYNNTEMLMRSLFVARGPYFMNGFLEPFENVGLYNVLCGSIGIKPAQNDGPSTDKIFQTLPKNWTDPCSYPDVDFEAEILQINSTYDALFGKDTQNFEVEEIVEAPSPEPESIPASFFSDDTPSTLTYIEPSSIGPVESEEYKQSDYISADPVDPADPEPTPEGNEVQESPSASETPSPSPSDQNGTSPTSAWSEWFGYIVDSAHKVGDWIGEKISNTKGGKSKENSNSG